jgi:hypothetical protein
LTKAVQLEKLRTFTPIFLQVAGVTDINDIFVVKAKVLSMPGIKGNHTNEESGTLWEVTGKTIKKELRQHDFKNIEHWQSVAAIPQIIKTAVYAGYLENQDKQKHPEISRFEYYLSEIVIAEHYYTVKSDIAVENTGKRRYFDHKLEDKKNRATAHIT